MSETTTPEQASRAAPTPWATIILLSLTAFGAAASQRLLDPLLPRLAEEYQRSLGATSMVVTAYAIAYALLQLVLGPFGDRYGKLRVIAIAAAVAAAATVLCALAGTLETLVAARILVGMACAAVIPLSMAWIGDNIPYEQRQPVLARFLIGQICGLASGQAFGGLAAEQPYWQWPFIVYATLFLLAALLLFKRTAGMARPPRSGSGNLLVNLKSVLDIAWARIVLVTVLCEGLFIFGAFAFIPSHLHYAGGLDLATAGLVMATFALGGLTFALFARRLVPLLGERWLASGGALLISAALLALYLWPHAAPATPASFVFGLGFYMLHNTLQTHATQMAPTRRGAAVSLFATAFFTGQSIGIAAAGLLAQYVGIAAVLVISALAIVPIGFGFAWRLTHRDRRQASPR